MKALRSYIRYILETAYGTQVLELPPPPKETREELGQVIEQYYNRYNPESIQYDLDERMELLFNNVIERSHGTNVTEYVKSLKKHPLDSVARLKKHFKRKRPEDVAADFGIEWQSDSVDMNTINNSYSYPSGHATQAYYIAHNLCDMYPEVKDQLMSIAEAVAQSRIDRGVHFPSDLDAGRMLAHDLYQKNKPADVAVIKEAMTSPNSVSGKYAIWTNLADPTDVDSISDGTELDFVMYNWQWAYDNLEKMIADGLDPEEGEIGHAEILEAITGQNENGYSSIAGVMRVRVYEDGMGCNSAWEVIRSAAEGGLGPTLYDMIMSIAPNGLMADRQSVSSSARNVWSFYANNRTSVDKDFLDPGGYTDTEYDDCNVHGDRVDPLRTATRLMAIEYFDDSWPYEHEIFKEKADMNDIMEAGNGDGEKYFETVSNWIEENQDDHDIDEWNIDEAQEYWSDWKIDGELELMDKLDSNFTFDDPDYLNLSYNTNYASDSFQTMWDNHWDLMQMIQVELEIPDGYNLLSEDPDAVHFAVRNYFEEKYDG